MSYDVLLAREFAVFHHGGQKYGADPYSVHLDEVVAVLREFEYQDDEDIMAGYLHDVVEDTLATIKDVEQRFGATVARIVETSTGIGPTRKVRSAMIISNLRSYPRAAPVKAADRIANMRSARGTSLEDMYRRELPDFLEVVGGHITPEMFAELETLGEMAKPPQTVNDIVYTYRAPTSGEPFIKGVWEGGAMGGSITYGLEGYMVKIGGEFTLQFDLFEEAARHAQEVCHVNYLKCCAITDAYRLAQRDLERKIWEEGRTGRSTS